MPWARVQGFGQNAQYSASGPFASTAIALGSAVRVGDTVPLATTAQGDTAGVPGTVADGLGNTWTLRKHTYDTTNNQSFDEWLCIIATAGTPTITYTPNTLRNWIAITGDHFTGAAFSALRDAQGQFETAPGRAADACDSTTIAAQSGDLLWGVCGAGASSITTVIGTGFTAGRTMDATVGWLTEWKVAIGAQAVTFTDATNGTVDHNTMGLAVSDNPHAAEQQVPAPASLDGWGE